MSTPVPVVGILRPPLPGRELDRGLRGDPVGSLMTFGCDPRLDFIVEFLSPQIFCKAAAGTAQARVPASNRI
jgi:hypothetical protein